MKNNGPWLKVGSHYFSAGATLSAVVTILARDNNRPPIKFQCLIYPTTDFTKDYSKHQPHEGSLLRKETIK